MCAMSVPMRRSGVQEPGMNDSLAEVRILWDVCNEKGTEAIAEAAVQAGCKSSSGTHYPRRILSICHAAAQVGTACQAEAIGVHNMLMGAGSTGYRVMTSSSSGNLLMSEDILHRQVRDSGGDRDVMRAGPGLGHTARTGQPPQVTGAEGTGTIT